MTNKNIYRVLVKSREGNVLADVSDYCTQRDFTWVRNRATKIRLEFNIVALNNLLVGLGLNVSSLFRLNNSEIWVYRNTNLIISGQVNYKSIRENADDSTISIEACGWLDVLAQRFTPPATVSYLSTDIGQIIKDLIMTTQADGPWADIGIVEGTIQTSRNADRTYYLDNIRQVVTNLTEVINSPDLEISPNKEINVYYPKQGVRRDNVVFTYPGNIRELSYESDGKIMANRVTATGSGSGDKSLAVTVNASAAAKQEAGLRSDVISFPDVSKASTLTEHANDEMSSRVLPMILPAIVLDGVELTPFIDYGLGDEIQIKILRNQAVWAEMAGFVRIEAINIDVDENNYERINLEIVKL